MISGAGRAGGFTAPEGPHRGGEPQRGGACVLLRDAQHFEIDGVGHRLIAGVVGVEVIARIVLRLDLLGRGLVAQQGIEVDYAVEFAAVADPVVYRLALGLFVLVVVAGERGILSCIIMQHCITGVCDLEMLVRNSKCIYI